MMEGMIGVGMGSAAEIEKALQKLRLQDGNPSWTPAEIEIELERLRLNNDVCVANDEKAAPSSHKDEIEATDTIQFNPPIYLQRYCAVQNLLAELLKQDDHKDPVNGCTVVEVGCAEFGMHIFLKTIEELGKIIFVDIDENLLQQRKLNLRPFPAEYLQRPTRPKPLVVEAYAGDITKVDTRIVNENPKVWSVVAIELVEHLYPQDLRGFEKSVFGVISPSVVVITTPNADFNPVFNLPSGKFRHWDHKFEWTRDEFLIWCQKICSEFPNYVFTTRGIGAGPLPQTENLGCVSQMAVFQKVHNTNLPCLTPDYQNIVQDDAYKLVESITYPNYIEKRTVEELIVNDLEYTKRHFWLSKRNIEYCMEHEISEFIYPLRDVREILAKTPKSPQIDLEFLRKVLTDAKYDICVINNAEYALRVPVPLFDTDPADHSDLDDEMDEGLDAANSFASALTSDQDESWD